MPKRRPPRKAAPQPPPRNLSRNACLGATPTSQATTRPKMRRTPPSNGLNSSQASGSKMLLPQNWRPPMKSGAVKRWRRPPIRAAAANLGVAIAVPIHWFDSLDSQNTQAWFVTDPPDGHIPPLTEEAKKRQAAQAARVASGRGTADLYTDRSTGYLCIAWSIRRGSNSPNPLRELRAGPSNERLRRHPLRDGARNTVDPDRRPCRGASPQ